MTNPVEEVDPKALSAALQARPYPDSTITVENLLLQGGAGVAALEAAIQAYLAASPSVGVRAYLPHDLFTHREAWRTGLVLAKHSTMPPTVDTDDRAYWQHEIEVFDRVFAALSALVSHPTPSGAQASLLFGDEGQRPVLWVSPAQLEDHVDPDPREGSEGGNYLPARKSMAGLFTMPLYTLPHQSREEIIEATDEMIDRAKKYANTDAAIRDLKGK